MNNPQAFAEAIEKGYTSKHYEQAFLKWIGRKQGEVVEVCPMCAALAGEGVDVSKKRNSDLERIAFDRLQSLFGMTMENYSQMLSWNDSYRLDWREIVRRIKEGHLG